MTKCKHEPDIKGASMAHDVLEDGDIIVDVPCKKCGKSGSAKVLVDDIMFDEECDDACDVHDPDPMSWAAEHVEDDTEFHHGFTDMTAICRKCNLVLCARIAHAGLSTGSPRKMGFPEDQ